MRIIVLFFCWLNLLAAGQNTADTSNFIKKWNAPHSPFKATLLSAALPSAGQIYNHKYWKAPIVVAGMGTCTYFIISNTRSYQHYKGEYIKAADNDPLTVSDYTAGQIKPVMDTYRKWMDLSYFSLIGVYALQVIDAHVDAHLNGFDVSPNLSFSWHPTVFFTGQNLNKGVQFNLNF